MLDVRLLGNSLDLRSYGRLMETKHPFLIQLKELLNSSDFFNVQTNAPVDLKMLNSLKLINQERCKILSWPIDVLRSSSLLITALGKIKLRSILTQGGKNSLHYLAIHRRCPFAKISDLTIREFDSIARYLIYRELIVVIRELLTGQILPTIDCDTRGLYPTKDLRMVNMVNLTSKALRLNQTEAEVEMICVYKIGLVLTPGELLSWTRRMAKLTSTRHKNILLRAAHGDIFSNERLFRFNLIDSPGCKNCQAQHESTMHRLLECPTAVSAWQHLNELKVRLGLSALTDLSIENVLGAKDKLTKIELALNAELIHSLAAVNEHPQPDRLIKSICKRIHYSEYLSPGLKASFERELRE